MEQASQMKLWKKSPDRINIGCGFDKRAGYLNIDSDPATSPDFLVVNNDLSVLPQGHFSEAIAMDVLEHIPRVFMMGALFDWAGLLRMGGTIHVETSNIFGIIDVMRREGTFEAAHNWKRCLFGNQVHPGDWHHNGFTEQTLPVYLRAVGLEPTEVFTREDWLLNVHARKAIDWTEFLAIKDHPTFVQEIMPYTLGRDAEEWRLTGPQTPPNSAGRLAEIKTFVTCEERLYMLGRG